MRRFTGPGKVKDNLYLPAARRKGLFASLYNFDVDDATVKKEHQQWLDLNAIPVLKAASDIQVCMRGSASRSGANAYNMQLSEKRVEAVKNFLMTKGIGGQQFSLQWVGEEEAALAGKADGTEEEEDRAVFLLVRPCNRRRTARFERLDPIDDEDGFEPRRVPQWLMVPANHGRRALRLVNGAGLRLVTDNPAVAQLISPTSHRRVDELLIGSRRQDVMFEGIRPGEADIFGFDCGGDVAVHLQISVLPHRTATVAFHYVREQDPRTGRITDQTQRGRPPAPGRDPLPTEDELLAVANRVFGRQANISLVKRSSGPVTFRQELGTVDTVSVGVDVSVLAPRGDNSARINVFFVWEFQDAVDVRDRTDTNGIVDRIGGRNMIMEDNAGNNQGLTFSHECGHLFGLEHDDSSTRLLMWDTTDEHRGRLQRHEILEANATAEP